MPADQVNAWVEAAERIEANGGEWLSYGSRRRTLGGIFFWFARDSLTLEQRAAIFPAPWRKSKQPKPPSAAQPPQDTLTKAPALLPASWDDRDTVSPMPSSSQEG